MVTGGMFVRISLGTEELDRDLDRIEDGELSLPTVSAVTISIDGMPAEEVPVWLAEA